MCVCIVTWLSDSAGVWIGNYIYWKTVNVATNNYNNNYESRTAEITVATAHMKSSVAVAW
jgi:hypothetical protein